MFAIAVQDPLAMQSTTMQGPSQRLTITRLSTFCRSRFASRLVEYPHSTTLDNVYSAVPFSFAARNRIASLFTTTAEL